MMLFLLFDSVVVLAWLEGFIPFLFVSGVDELSDSSRMFMVVERTVDSYGFMNCSTKSAYCRGAA